MQVGSILLNAWLSFEQQCIHKDAGPKQRAEMRKAFYGGAVTVLSVTLAIGEETVSEAHGMRIMESLHKEVQAFAAGLEDNGKGGLTNEPIIITP